MGFQYIKDRYKVPAEMNREVIVNGKKGVIMQEIGSYIGVIFYDNVTVEPLPCHATWNVEYLETFNYEPPVIKLTASQKRYRDFLKDDSGLSFSEWLGIKKKLNGNTF